MGKKSTSADVELCFEDALEKLEETVRALEEGELGLAEALHRYEDGVKHLKRCYALLENAQRRIELVTGVDENGNPRTTPLDDAEAGSLDEKAESRGKRRSQPVEGKRPARDHGASDDAASGNDIDSPGSLF
ncbi:MAG: exodeoxyribonuclease VII small subunit [Pirellulales bacterium]